MVDIVKLFGKDHLDKLLGGHYENPKFFNDVPDGVYDNQYYSYREIIYKGYPVMCATIMWLNNGGPDTWVNSITTPEFGSFPDPKTYVLEYGEDD